MTDDSHQEDDSYGRYERGDAYDGHETDDASDSHQTDRDHQSTDPAGDTTTGGNLATDGGEIDPVTLEVLRNAFATVAEEMSANLIRTSYSPNIKERKDASSAVFDARGRMLAQAENIPVHLGAMPHSVRTVVEAFEGAFEPGDTVIHNSPFSGGAHLPDITFVSPVFVDGKLVAYVANRAHHADVGGSLAGSVSADATSVFAEGIQIPPVKLFERGEIVDGVLDLLTENVRTPDEREGDLRAQQAANETGRQRFEALVEKHGRETVEAVADRVLDYSERRMREEVRDLADGVYEFADALDSDGAGAEDVTIRATVTIDGSSIAVDFAGSAQQVAGAVNAPIAVTTSATYYALRAVTDPDIPPNQGCYRPFSVSAPEGTVVNACKPAAVVGGNLETSQRIVDTVLGAMAEAGVRSIAAAANGSMNNVTFGSADSTLTDPYTFYETIGGGYGARPERDGVDGVHAHMTNTQNTPIEALELAYPLRVERYELRPDTGGAGEFRGGLGIRRDIRVLGHDASFSLLSDRRRNRPYGLDGGQPGATGEDRVVIDGEERHIDSKTTLELSDGDLVSVRTPGGGGFGPPEDRSLAAITRDLEDGRLTAEHVAEHYPHYDGE
ncbi:hydantoinase B/oxoprolinase family protein [Halapricum hydrolyticum]|uniref:Hydantoinase B/oxoprolinase family protein n=1 Tax=Halapricum hydrolyticum TaxID=2979991 RepID=A0AAE3ID37_9EURY|nr:hydantoinase B/oxoprolinase family protein [Halapricum hydrolyticum]MCU4718915.1 hydantoinase B/oxoprolinase family protein [Halapricum hydrolyticum]MCU4727992.1 hydantoinase B/oxoprolinase family protein [Halapricum hydrolyticum]